jgi:hypothetical protein
MIEDEEPKNYIQPYITDFRRDVDIRAQKRIELRRRLKLVVQWHLEEFVRLHLMLMQDPMTLGTLLGYITDSLSKMEDKEICYLKRMPDGMTYVFKRAYCWEGVKNWKKCPEFRCLVQFPCCDLPCPNGDHYYDDPFENLTEDQKRELRSFIKRLEEESSGKQN